MASTAAVTGTFHPHDTLANTARTTIGVGGCGLLIAALQNTLRKQNVGAMGVFTRSGHVIAFFATSGAAYQFTRDSAANLRRENDAYNDAIGGFASGLTMGVFHRSLPKMLGMGAFTAIAMSAFAYTGGLAGNKAEIDDDEVERREAAKKLRRRPLQETIDQLGEGRGIYAPGWEERRRQRLLEKYGVDVGEAQGGR